MKRSALKRNTYLQHGKPLKQASDHRRREDRERAPILKALREGPCQARLDGCLGRATDGHEILSRALVEANYRDDRQRELWRGYELAAAGGGR